MASPVWPDQSKRPAGRLTGNVYVNLDTWMGTRFQSKSSLLVPVDDAIAGAAARLHTAANVKTFVKP